MRPWCRAGGQFRCHDTRPLGRGRGNDLGLQSECWIPDRCWTASLKVTATWTTIVCETANWAVWAPRPPPPPPPDCRVLTAALGFPQVVDKWFKSNDEEAFAFARMLIAQEGLLCGEWTPRSALLASVQRGRDTLTLAAWPPAPQGSEFRGRRWWCSAEQMGE